MWKPPTGEPCAGQPPTRFGGRGERKLFPTPIVLLSDAGADYLGGGVGEDIIVAGAGDDTIYGDGSVTAAQLGWSVARTRTDVGNTATFNVTPTNITLAKDDALGGLDIIYGGAGADWIFAGAGDDYVEGGIGDDVLFGEAGHDVIVGGEGNDFIAGDSVSVDTAGLSGDDYLVGEAGDAVPDEKRGLIFQARVKLDQATLRVDQRDVTLTPGIAVSAEISTGCRRVIEFFLDPNTSGLLLLGAAISTGSRCVANLPRRILKIARTALRKRPTKDLYTKQ